MSLHRSVAGHDGHHPDQNPPLAGIDVKVESPPPYHYYYGKEAQ
jgi:hypothetical protein